MVRSGGNRLDELGSSVDIRYSSTAIEELKIDGYEIPISNLREIDIDLGSREEPKTVTMTFYIQELYVSGLPK